ncbi:MAG: fasciclin domain-containing protein [Methylococcaceae bacterium]|nr:fasciclin domain-containing protein [Prolixibacteraceae bacterium]
MTTKIRLFLLKLGLFSIIAWGCTFCAPEPVIWKVDSAKQVASDYISTHPEFSEFAKLVKMNKLEALLGIRGPFTIMLPNNDAMFAYYKEKGKNSLEDFDAGFLKTLIRTHLITNEISSGDVGLGAIRDTNAIGDYLVTEFQGSDIILNKKSKIIDRDIRLANGYVHVIDKVIDPVIKDVYTMLADDPSFKIFAEGLRISGLKDTLQVISFPYGKQVARTRYTILAVPDTIYQRNGINNVNDLIKWTGANPDSVTYLNNPFYRYMEYHCLNGTYYLNAFSSKLYPILSSDNNISITIDTDYKINYDPKTKEYTAFDIPLSNIPAKNGSIHIIKGLLPVTQPEPSTIIFETTDFFDFKQGDYFQKYYAKFNDGEHGFENIHWVGDYLQYHFKVAGGSGLINEDCLQMIGWFSVSVTFPKVMKGKWEVSIFQPNWQDVTSCTVYIDGVMANNKYLGPRTGGPGGLQKIADVDFKTTSRHTIRLENFFYGMVFWDYVQFKPIK